MTTFALSTTTILGAMLALSLQAAPVQAQATRTWVSSTGGGTMCTRAAPCATFVAAHTATGAGGEINCVDAADYGSLTITKSISIICDNTQAGRMTAVGSSVVIQAGANDVVVLKGLDFDGQGSALSGIHLESGGALHLHKVNVRNFRGAGAVGVFFQPDTAFSELYIADSYISDNGEPGGTRGGIEIMPRGSASVNASINRVRLENNATGLSVNGTQSAGIAINAIIVNSTVSGSTGNGIQAVSAGGMAAVSVLVDHSVVTGNFASGINANGAAANGAGSAVVRIGDATIALNANGVSTTGAGVVQSFKNNRISGNLTDGTPIAAFPGPGGTPLQ